MSSIDPLDTRDESRLFDDTRGFFRVRSQVDIAASLQELVLPGAPLTHDEVDIATRLFLDVLTESRPVDVDVPNTLEYAERNNLLLLFSPEYEAIFTQLYSRMPAEDVDAWRRALRGGDPRDSFGPLTAAERLDERRIEADIRTGRRQRRVRTGLAVVALALVVGGVVWWNQRSSSEVVSGRITFDPVVDRSGDVRAGPTPVVAKALVARLDRPLVVKLGAGDVGERIVLDAPATDLPEPPGAIAATLFRYNGAGQVVLVGPPGWLAKACIQASVMASSLRAFDTAYVETVPGACGKDKVIGRAATVGCVDAKQATVMLDLVIPEGSVNLSEGGTASVAAVRVWVVGSDPAFERNNISAQISVPDGTQIKVPTFGGAVGATVSFDVSAPTGAPLVGTCTLR